MLKIKLMPVGKKNARQYRIVVAEENSKLTGKVTAFLGFYHPRSREIQVDNTRMKSWINRGAQPTPSVRKLLFKSD
ncbi:30S ribosomal protein S16 [Candidatus Amesbacteria bacterium RIFCSPLOWO2_02_FULL_48_11]|uniref:Small ribosomal subunit protein bS16 n=4 Tax=Candidatus Amesiibacteriota TaxID=1752730 RepID=A0A1F4Z5L6_9BACT|nr:MAG: 30S ribosomal protein S16 [Candidatus Amesbacteria bacterium GW2011_GWA2_47_11]KKU94196.1 MAG: 30S ribosomal protein S16 [Candidatus Amesbacteria bacterium GW2011_GWC1_48_10]KKW00498.1 MAG: 30S ribosomal protein S16 [Candidatus Amesbacteria bacterium GW2011_GWA1_48_9]OGC89091.1 MAG: 30S ribosomal protein S16 [Candidatus Amesbacteria bacterium RBG_19FT_COMBO_48_16]OGC95357.1 MAG: 30S ribosomal protein S16 [Candidatus Amesbacteria bacterium RIFCSPHIGHO2_02_FULL_48_21]OGC98659.1 MAG: 30S 